MSEVDRSYKLSDLSQQINEWAHSKGWWKTSQLHELAGRCDEIFGKLLMIHSEVTEAAEEVRTNNSDKVLHEFWVIDGKPEGFASELMDILIRTLDMCGELGIDVDYGLQMKMKFNETRPFRHGNKLI
jgi:NTP pyrophosphatase (non-canonical NTP hydrolase)